MRNVWMMIGCLVAMGMLTLLFQHETLPDRSLP